MGQWGELMRYYYHKDEDYRKLDLTVNYLGYWTDTGKVDTPNSLH